MPDSRSIKVSVPRPPEDRTGFGRVGVIAAACFGVGVLWPTLAGVRLVPTVPTKEAESAPSKKVTPKPPRNKSDGPPVSPKSVAAVAVAPNEVKAGGSRIKIEKTLVVNCRDAEDRRLNDCDKPAFDEVAKDRLLALSTCEGAEGATGVLSIGFDLDFGTQKIRRVLRGKSSTVDEGMAEALLECSKREFMSATLRGVAHTHNRYLVFYMVRFAGTAEELAEGGSEAKVVRASGSATIIWNSARIRSEPEDGKVRARVLYGTKVFVTGRQDDWYRVRYDGQGNEGWIHKNALAL